MFQLQQLNIELNEMKNYHELKEAAIMHFKLLPQYQPCKTEINHNKPQSWYTYKTVTRCLPNTSLDH